MRLMYFKEFRQHRIVQTDGTIENDGLFPDRSGDLLECFNFTNATRSRGHRA